MANHPLEALPVSAIREWAVRQAALVTQPVPLRERVRAYVTKRGGNATPLLLFKIKSTFRPDALTTDELLACKMTTRELFGDEGVAASLAELKQSGAVSSAADLMALQLKPADVFGPFSSVARHDRLSPTVLRRELGIDVMKALFKDGFNLTLIDIITAHASSLYPGDFAALSLRFDEALMQKPVLLDIIREHAVSRLMFRAFPEQRWRDEAGLTETYLAALLKTNKRAVIDEWRTATWKPVR
jgi:hypothetical protein